MMNAQEMNATHKAHVGQWFEMADKALDETGKLMDLQLNACRETIEEMAHCCQSACDVHDLASAFNWQTGALKPFAERSAEYGARWMGLASGSGLDLGRSFEAQWENLGRQMTAWMGQGMVPTPSSAGPSIDYLRNTMQAFDKVWDSMRQNMVQVQQNAAQKGAVHKLQTKGGSRKAEH